MCSFLIYKKNKFNQELIKKCIDKLKLRGPDYTNIIEFGDYIFVHNLLHICGEITIQPFVYDNIVALFNGEIYNYKDFGNYKSDGCCLIPLYNQYGESFVTKLDGEFSIIIFDFNKQEILLSSDIFSTKPLWYSINNSINQTDILISSLPSTFNILDIKEYQKSRPNECIILDMNDFSLKKKINIYNFDLYQHKTNFDDWNNAFEQAILKRINNNKFKIGLCLSSGYDSGSIACVLEKYNIPFESYTMTANENIDILNQRISNKNDNYINYTYSISEKLYNKNKNSYQKNIENIIIDVTYGKYNLIDDWAGIGLYYLYTLSRKNNTFIFLSGTGGDEIFSDYGWKGENIKKCEPHKKKVDGGTFMGLFPEDLATIFPWFNFYTGLMEAFIAKEEYTGSLHGIENRYPFLDKNVVQEFLWLSVELKNNNYKSPLYNYMKINNYPFKENEKIGFKAKVTTDNISNNNKKLCYINLIKK